MRNWILFLLLTCLATLQGRAQSAVDQDNGILGFALGADQDSFTGIFRDGKAEKLARFRTVDDSLLVEGILTKKVLLYFWERKLHSIEVKLLGAEAEKMLVWLRARYGDGVKEDAMGFRLTWEGKRVRVFWDQNLVTKDATLTFLDDVVHVRYYDYMKSME